jgi:hypothetical protein
MWGTFRPADGYVFGHSDGQDPLVAPPPSFQEGVPRPIPTRAKIVKLPKSKVELPTGAGRPALGFQAPVATVLQATSGPRKTGRDPKAGHQEQRK